MSIPVNNINKHQINGIWLIITFILALIVIFSFGISIFNFLNIEECQNDSMKSIYKIELKGVIVGKAIDCQKKQISFYLMDDQQYIRQYFVGGKYLNFVKNLKMYDSIDKRSNSYIFKLKRFDLELDSMGYECNPNFDNCENDFMNIPDATLHR